MSHCELDSDAISQSTSKEEQNMRNLLLSEIGFC